MNNSIPWPLQKNKAHPIIPVFIPFSGCPQRCIFCAQQQQSGTSARSTEKALSQLHIQLQERNYNSLTPPDVAFFGGTFTALPPKDLALCLEFTHLAKKNKFLRHVRCSTRPDALYTPGLLKSLHNAAFTTVELGIQSYSDLALQKARRHYSSLTARQACRLIADSDLELVVQLMPGMPGVSPEVFLEDVALAVELGAQALRFYPCQVLEGTELAHLWREGQYEPWDMETTLDALSQGLCIAMKAGVPVIRMGLAPEPGLEEHILAGPRHPALGAMVQSEALWHTVYNACKGQKLRSLSLPEHFRGFFWGNSGSQGSPKNFTNCGNKDRIAAKWRDLGIGRKEVLWHKKLEIYFERS